MLRRLQAVLFFPSVTRGRICLLLGITIAAASFEGFSIGMLFPVLDFIEKGKDFGVLAHTSRMWFHIDRTFDLIRFPKNLISLMGVVFVLLLLRQLLNYLKSIYGTWITESIFSDIRSAGFRWFANADLAFRDTAGVGQLVNVLTVDGIRAGSGVFSFFNLLNASVIFMLYFSFLLMLSTGMTLFACAIMACVGVILRSRIRRSGVIGDELSRFNDRITAAIVERLNGVRFIKLSATEDIEAQLIRNLSHEIRARAYSLSKIKAKMEFTVDPLVILAGLVILYFSAEVFHMTLARTGIFLFVLLRLMPYTKEIFNSRQAMAGFSGSLFRVIELFQKAQNSNSIQGGNVEFTPISEGIRVEKVSFRYQADHPVLEDVDVFIPASKMTALVGRSGAGKSTLVDLIPRLRDPQAGSILMDGVPVKEFDLRSLRRAIAFVSQEGFLFDDTVENNVRYSRPDATPQEIQEALELAYADRFVKDMPEGIATMVGERGARLSGGQKQRIILARALLQNASIIILDEPTSSLDSESEMYIQQSMEEIRKRKRITFIIIAHRLATIRKADQIIVLDKGKVVETGSHAELMHEDTWYADMVRIQAVG